MADTSDGKKTLLEGLEKTYGNVSEACRQCGISRDTHYRWLKEDAQYKASVEEITNVAIDFVEGKLFEKINGVSVQTFNSKGEPIVYDVPPSDTAIIFFLKTKAKKRGYVERTEQEISLVKPIILDWSDTNNNTPDAKAEGSETPA